MLRFFRLAGSVRFLRILADNLDLGFRLGVIIILLIIRFLLCVIIIIVLGLASAPAHT